LTKREIPLITDPTFLHESQALSGKYSVNMLQRLSNYFPIDLSKTG